MSRPLRVEFGGALYHVTSRGDRREAIFKGDDDRRALLGVVAQAMERFDAEVLAYCLMGNHYHFVVVTHQANLSQLMRHINGIYTQQFNRQHGLVGHLFQGRFKAILVDRDAYLLEVCRYVELNPVRAGMVDQPAQWAWSSYRAHTGLCEGPAWLNSRVLHEHLLQREVKTLGDGRVAARRYEALVRAGLGVDLWGPALNRQVFLGDDAFVARVRQQADSGRLRATAVPKRQRCVPSALQQWFERGLSREEALRRAYLGGGFTMVEMAAQLGITAARVGQLIAKAEQRQQGLEGGSKRR